MIRPNLRCGDIRYQCGAAGSGMVFGLLLSAILLFFIVKLLPVYVDHNFVTSVTRSMLDRNGLATMSESQIRQDLEASLRLNNVRTFDIDDVYIYREGSSTVVHIQYEKRIPVIGNIDLLVKFDEVIR